MIEVGILYFLRFIAWPLIVAVDFVADNGVRFGDWAARQRRRYQYVGDHRGAGFRVVAPVMFDQ